MKSAGLQALAILSLCALSRTEASTITAADPSLASVQAAVNSAASGQTVQVPAGSATWTGTLTITNDIQLIGAGIDQTVIADGGNPNTLTLVNWTTSSNHFDRLSGFTFLGTNNTEAYNGSITINGTCHAFRLDDCKFNLLNTCNVQFNGWVFGVVDHCIFWHPDVFGVQVNHDGWGGWQYGDGSWASPDSFGTTNAMYIESCSFTNNGSSPGAFDMLNGGRIVFRYNNLTNDNVGFHGTETGVRQRSGRAFEVYNNDFQFLTNANTSWFSGVFIRGGSGVIFSNTFYNYETIGNMAAFRVTANNGPWPTWGNADGFNGWDTNGSDVYVSGTATATTVNYFTDSTKSWAVNQWVTNFGAFVLEDTVTTNASQIVSNTSNTIYMTLEKVGNASTYSSGDSYRIGYVYQVLDQPGVGMGHLLTNYIPVDSVTGKTNWSEVVDPIYEWANSLKMPLQNPSWPYLVPQHTTIISNLNYVDGAAKPGYVPLVYPHPLVSGTPSAPTYTLTVVNGTGSGAYVSNSVVTISPNSIVGEAFKNWSGLYVGNTNSATTTVTMPGTNLTVTANFVSVPTYTLTVENGTGSGTYNPNSVVSISANTFSGESFAYWVGSNIANTNSATTTVVTTNANLTVTAVYISVPDYTLTVVNGSGSGTYTNNSIVSIAANTIAGENFAYWVGSNIANTNAASTTVTMPANAVTVTANYVSAPGQTNSSTTVTNGLIAQWTLAGDVNDHVGTNNGVAYGSPAYVPGPTGVADAAISLNGTSQYVLTTTLGNFGSNCSSGFTLTAWVQSSYASGVEAIFGSGSQSESGMAVYLYLNYATLAGGGGAGMIEGWVRDNANSSHLCDITSNSGITDGNWHFVAWVDNPAANAGTIYVDGVALNTYTPASAAGATINLPNPMGLGIRVGLNDGLFNGSLTDCRIYNRTLSSAEVSTLYSSGAAGAITTVTVVAPPSGLQAHP